MRGEVRSRKDPTLERLGFRRMHGEGGGGASIVTLDDLIRQRVAALTGGSRFGFWSDSFMAPMAQRGSPWQGGDGFPRSEMPGAVVEQSRVAGSSFFGSALVSVYRAGGGAVDSTSFFGDMQADRAGWCYCFARLALSDRSRATGAPWIWYPDQHAFFVGMLDDNTRCGGIGIARGHSHWGAVGGFASNAGGTVGIDSTVPLDVDGSGHVAVKWHDAEFFRIGGVWTMQIDDAPPIDPSPMWLDPPGTPPASAFRFGHPALYVGYDYTDAQYQIPSILVEHLAFAVESAP